MGPNEMINKRQSSHGEFNNNSRCTWVMLEIAQKERNWDKLTYGQKHGLYMILHKVARILEGDPNFADHWDDIAGYAAVVSQRLPLIPEPKPTKWNGEPLPMPSRYSPGTPEDGGHHSRYSEPEGKPEEPLIDGLTYKPAFVHVRVGEYYLVDRLYYSEGAVEHLRSMDLTVSYVEHANLPAHYQLMYDYKDNGRWELKPQFITGWGIK